jgi:hypothetical protein
MAMAPAPRARSSLLCVKISEDAVVDCLSQSPCCRPFPSALFTQANAKRTNALNPQHQYVPWVLVNGTLVPDPPTGGPSQAKVLAAICDAYTGTQPACCTAEALAALEKAHPAPPPASKAGKCYK